MSISSAAVKPGVVSRLFTEKPVERMKPTGTYPKSIVLAEASAEGEKLPQRSHRAPARSSRQQHWDPRRSEPQEPAYVQMRKPDPSRPAPVIQRKRSFGGIVGALLGRKPQTEE